MSDQGSELPSPGGATGRSVFSVFGFHGNRLHDEDAFNEPLETAPESFDSHTSLVNLPRRSSRRGSRDLIPPLTPETARKLRLNLPDNSKLVLQSLSQQTGKLQQGPPQLGNSDNYQVYARRYSTPQGETSEDTFQSNELLRSFNSSVTQTSAQLYGRRNEQQNLYSNFKPYVQDDSNTATSTIPVSTPEYQPQPAKQLSRNISTPEFGQSGALKSVRDKIEVESSVDAPPRSNIIAKYLTRRQSHDDILVLSRKMAVEEKDKTPTEQLNKAVVPTSSEMQMSTQVSQSDHTDSQGSHSGRGIFSRTRQFGAWLTKATDGEKVEVTKKDLNILAPNSF